MSRVTESTTSASNIWLPTFDVPSVHFVLATPSADVRTTKSLTLPPPFITWKTTGQSEIGVVQPSLTCTLTGNASSCPTTSTWFSPLRATSDVGGPCLRPLGWSQLN